MCVAILRPLALRCAPPSGVLFGRVSRVFVRVRDPAFFSARSSLSSFLYVHRCISTFTVTANSFCATVNEISALSLPLFLPVGLALLCRSWSWRGNCGEQSHHIILYSTNNGYTKFFFFVIFFGTDNYIGWCDVLTRSVNTRRIFYRVVDSIKQTERVGTHTEYTKEVSVSSSLEWLHIVLMSVFTGRRF